jgi:protein phosphatase
MSSGPFNWDQFLAHAAATDVGMRRANNQDSHAVVIADSMASWFERGHIFIVADGMGAHAAGELASKLAVDGIPFLYHKYRDQSPPEALQRAIIETNAEINRRGKANSDFHNMGTTCSVLLLVPQGAVVAHIGDSRVYRVRGDVLEQLTFDHSMVWEMRAAGNLPEDGDLARAIPKNVITRSLGPHVNVQVDVEGPFPIEAGDTFLLCSDGLSGQVEDDELGAIVGNMPPKEAAQLLVDLANLRGGPDNITVVIAKVLSPQVSTAAANAEPLTVGADKETRAVHPGMWIGVGVCFLAALVLWMVTTPLVGLLAAVAGVIVLGIALLMQFGGGRGGIALTGGKRLGRGPYVHVECAAGDDFISKLSEIVDKLRESAVERQYNIDWTGFNQACERASEARQQSRASEAVREYGRAVSTMMQELRNRNKKKASDSSVL